ncbi:MAG: aminotransferase class IV [Eubacterium sp.]
MKINFDEGYAFGLGVFETIAVEKEKPIFLEAHLKRLENSMNFLEISGRVLKEEVIDYLKEHPMDHGVLKIMVSPQNKIFSTRDNPYLKEHYERGFTLDYSKVLRNETSALTFHKTMNYGDCILEKRHAAKIGLDEVLFLNTKGAITEGTTTNVFFIKKEQIYTPKISSGLLPGIMRDYVYKTKKVIDTTIYPENVKDFEACFLTNSLLGIMPVKQLGTHVFAKKYQIQPLPVTMFL